MASIATTLSSMLFLDAVQSAGVLFACTTVAGVIWNFWVQSLLPQCATRMKFVDTDECPEPLHSTSTPSFSPRSKSGRHSRTRSLKSYIDAVSAVWCRMADPSEAVVHALAVLRRPCSMSDIGNMLQEKLVPSDFRFTSRLKSDMWGRWYWEPVGYFQIEKHLVEYSDEIDDSTIDEFLSSRLNSPLNLSDSPWSCIVLTNYCFPDGRISTAVVFRFHHALADGFAFLHCVFQVLDTPTCNSLSPPPINSRSHSRQYEIGCSSNATKPPRSSRRHRRRPMRSSPPLSESQRGLQTLSLEDFSERCPPCLSSCLSPRSRESSLSRSACELRSDGESSTTCGETDNGSPTKECSSVTTEKESLYELVLNWSSSIWPAVTDFSRYVNTTIALAWSLTIHPSDSPSLFKSQDGLPSDSPRAATYKQLGLSVTEARLISKRIGVSIGELIITIISSALRDLRREKALAFETATAPTYSPTTSYLISTTATTNSSSSTPIEACSGFFNRTAQFLPSQSIMTDIMSTTRTPTSNHHDFNLSTISNHESSNRSNHESSTISRFLTCSLSECLSQAQCISAESARDLTSMSHSCESSLYQQPSSQDLTQKEFSFSQKDSSKKDSLKKDFSNENLSKNLSRESLPRDVLLKEDPLSKEVSIELPSSDIFESIDYRAMVWASTRPALSLHPSKSSNGGVLGNMGLGGVVITLPTADTHYTPDIVDDSPSWLGRFWPAVNTEPLAKEGEPIQPLIRRVDLVHRRMQASRHRNEPMAMNLFFRLLSIMPTRKLFLFCWRLASGKPTVSISSLAGCPNPITIGTVEAERLVFFSPPQGNMGVTFGSLSYEDKFYISVAADAKLMDLPTCRRLLELVDLNASELKSSVVQPQRR